MRNSFLIFILLAFFLAPLSDAQTTQKSLPKLDGLLGIRFGDSIETCANIMKTKGTKSDDIPDKRILLYENVVFGGRHWPALTLYFYQNHLMRAALAIAPSPSKTTDQSFSDADAMLIKLYPTAPKSIDDSQNINMEVFQFDNHREVSLIKSNGRILVHFDDTTLISQSEKEKNGKNQAPQNSAPQLDGFWGMKFGDSIESCQKVMKDHTATPIPGKPEDHHLLFSDVDFAGRPACGLNLVFYKSKFTMAILSLPTLGNEDVADELVAVRNDLEQKYNDKGVLQDLGDGQIQCVWVMDSGKHGILLMASTSNRQSINLIYRDVDLTEEYIKDSDKVRTKDY